MGIFRRGLVTLLLCAVYVTKSEAWGQDTNALQRLPRWDYWPPLPSRPRFTGDYLASRPGQIHLKRQQFGAINLFDLEEDAVHPNVLLYGSVLLKPTVVTADLLSNSAIRGAVEFTIKSIKDSAGVNVATSLDVKRAVILPLYITGDNGHSEMVVAHQYTTTRRQAREFQSHVTLGTNFYLTLEDPKFGIRHRVIVSLDREGAHNLFQHTFTSIDGAGRDDAYCAADGHNCATPSSNPRILSYNVWNTNPSNDVYGSVRRWDQYISRMDHLVKFVKESRADIVGFQEVRYDGVFGDVGGRAQVQHLAARMPGFQFVYQAAMSYINDRSPYERIEEGPAIFSKFPIVRTDYLLLSRDPNDPNDSHQRLCLHAVVNHPNWGEIDVYVTHLSLGERSREQTMVEIWNFMQQGKGVTQVLLGDLNAEPHSRGIKFLRGEEVLADTITDLKDAWLERHSEAVPRSEDEIDKATKFTFPSDNASKRIDFVLYRGKGKIKECEIIGQQPTEETAHFPRDVGMLNSRSPVYASDHRGVVTEFSDS